MKRLHLSLLGPFLVRLADGRAIHVRRRKGRATLAYLAMRPGELQPREKLIGLLWGDAAPAMARHSLRQTLTSLREDLAAWRGSRPFLAGDAFCLDPDLVTVDVAAFERLSDSTETESLEQAAAMYRGDFLEGIGVEGDAFEEWRAAERERLRATAVHVLDRLLATRIAAGTTAPIIQAAIQLLRVDPTREDVHRVLMRLYAREGRRPAAIRQYRTCAAILRSELDVTPEDETAVLYRAILGQRSRSLAARSETVRLQWLAATGAVGRSAFPEAVACLEQALSASKRELNGRARLTAALDIRLGFERALMPLGEVDRLREHLREAAAGTRILGDRRRLGWALAQGMSCDLWAGNAEAAVAAGERAMRDAVAANDRELRLTVACRLAQAYFYFGDFRQSARIAGDLAAARPAGELSLTASAQGALPAVHYRAYLALSLTALGHYAEAREAAREGVRLAERAAHDWSLAFALCGLGTCDLFQGRARDASDSFATAQGLERSADGTQRFVLPGAPIGSAHALAGRRAEGIALIESALHVSTLRGFGTFRQRSLASLARWRLREGRFEEALAYAEEALRLARAQRQRAGEASGLHLLAEILARSDAGEAAGRRALAACLDALTHAEALGMRPLVAQCHESLGALWERAGEADRARAARAAATELCQTLGLARTAAMEPFRTLGPVRTAGG
jgi:DNA-binding SARP family transcriptional activator